MKKPFKVMSTTALTAAFAAAAVVPVQAEVVSEVETSFSGIVFDVEGVNTVVSYSDYFNAIIDLGNENENELLDVIVGEDGLVKPPTYVQVGDNFYSASDYVDVVVNNEGSSLDELIQTLTSEKTPLTEEDTEDFVPYEPGDGELVVESVSAINATVDSSATEQQYLGLTINDGQEVAVADLVEEGYEVEFKASKKVFKAEGGASATSETGELDNTALTAGQDFKYQVVVSKDGEVVDTSALADVKVEDFSKVVTEITDIVAVKGSTELESNTIHTNDTIKFKVKGYTKKGSDEAEDITKLVKLSSDKVSTIYVGNDQSVTVVGTGKATIKATFGEDVSYSEEFEVVDTERAVKDLKVDKSAVDVVVGDTTGEKVTLTVLDQYGDPFAGAAVNLKVATEKVDVQAGNTQVGTTGNNVQTDAKGQVELTITAKADATAGEETVTLKVGDKEVEINVAVAKAGNTVKYVLEGEEEYDLADSSTVALTLQGYDANNLKTETADLNQYKVTSSDKDVVSVGDSNVLTAKKPGEATITVEKIEEAVVTESYTFVVNVKDTRAKLTAVEFEDEADKLKITADNAAIELAKILSEEGFAVSPNTASIAFAIDNDNASKLLVKQVKDNDENPKNDVIGTVTVTPIGLGNDAGAKFTDDDDEGLEVQFTPDNHKDGIVLLVVRDAYGNSLGELQIEVTGIVKIAGSAPSGVKAGDKQITLGSNEEGYTIKVGEQWVKADGTLSDQEVVLDKETVVTGLINGTEYTVAEYTAPVEGGGGGA